MPTPKLKLAVLISGGGTTLLNIQDQIEAGQLDAEVVQVISSLRKAKGVARSEDRGLPVEVIRKRDFESSDDYAEAMWSCIRKAGAELVVMAGFLSLLPIPEDYRNKVMNIHPGLLPSFGGQGMHGHHVHEAVIAYGAKVSGCTVHFADDQYDQGPIIVQKICPVFDTDDPDALASRVFEQECLAYPEAIQLFAEGRLSLEGRVVKISP